MTQTHISTVIPTWRLWNHWLLVFLLFLVYSLPVFSTVLQIQEGRACPSWSYWSAPSMVSGLLWVHSQSLLSQQSKSEDPSPLSKLCECPPPPQTPIFKCPGICAYHSHFLSVEFIRFKDFHVIFLHITINQTCIFIPF